MHQHKMFAFVGEGGFLTVHLSYDDLRFPPAADAQQEQFSPQTFSSSLLTAFRH
jgi:hypothetical protein